MVKIQYIAGTFDVSVVNVDNGNAQVKAINKDTHLGGHDIDDKLFNYVLKAISDKYGKDCASTPQNSAKLMQKIETAKIQLSVSLEATSV